VKTTYIARLLVILGCAVLIATAAFHWLAAYPNLSRALGASNFSRPLVPGLRAVFLLVGWDWIAITIIALIAAFRETRASKLIVLVCALATLVSAGIAFRFVGWFVGNEMLGVAGILMLCGGFLLSSSV
jgi:hypothetical protein